MNAYELADELENKPLAYGDDIQTWLVETVIMLRQQADRIAELENEISTRSWVRKLVTQTKQSEPVAIPFCWYCAWLGEKDEPVREQYEECHPATKQWDNFPDKTIPLYTTPHHASDVKQTKPLSDEEILQQAEWIFGISHFESIDDPYWIGFARAIEAKVKGQ